MTLTLKQVQGDGALKRVQGDMILMLFLLLVLSSCRTVRKSTAESSRSSRIETEAIQVGRELKLERFEFGDTLTGLIPIRIPRGSPPVTIPVESGGIVLELTLTDSTVGYRAVARPVARSQLSYGENKTEDRRRETEDRSETTEEVERKSRGFPWWVWLIAVIAAALAVLRWTGRIRFPFQ